jgi:hypothetical protein
MRLSQQLQEATKKPGTVYLSGEWYDIKKFIGAITDVELRAMAEVFKKHGFTVKVKRGAKYPDNEEGEGAWPDAMLSKWDEAVDAAMNLIERYRKLKKAAGHLGSVFHDKVRRYCIDAFEATPRGHRKGANPKKVWAEFSPEERLYMILDEKLAKEDGTPTPEAVSRGANIKS